MKFKRVLTLRWVLSIVVTCTVFGFGMGAAPRPGKQMSTAERQMFDGLMSGDPNRTREVLDNLYINYRMYDLSLAVREQVDFLLTPALLVQEAVSDDVVLTYPEE
jgi:hypothetical protein